MALGFLVRRAPATMYRRRADLFARLISSSSSSSSSLARILSPPPPSSRQQDLVGGVRVPSSLRHLSSVAERADVRPDVQGTECAPGGLRREPLNQRYQSGFHVEGRDAYGFRGRDPLDRGLDGRFSAHSPGGLSAATQHMDGFSGGLQRSSSPGQNFDGSGNWQQNLNGFVRGNTPPGTSRDYLDASAGENNGGLISYHQGVGRFPERPPSNIHPDAPRQDHGRAAEQQPEGGGGGTFHKGSIEELDGFLSEGKAKEAVQVLGLLEKEGKSVDLDRCLKLIETCGDAKAPEEAKAVHGYMTKTMGGDLGVRIHNRILRVFCTCESIDDARKLFDTMPERNITSWETMMLGLADGGLGEDAVDLFNTFIGKGLAPDGHMFIALFRVCASLGAVDEGMLHFDSMKKVHGISPTMDHYASIVRMHGEAGYLDEALEFVGKMQEEPGAIVWESLMTCARIQGNAELGDRCAEIVELLDPSRLSGESKAGLLPAKAADRAAEKQRKANLLEVRSRVHEYRAGDTSHPEKDRIYALIKGLAATLRESGYVPDTRFVLHDVEQESKEEALLAHSERLATAYGLISSSARSPIRIIKNLRICGDCHSYMKIMSKAVGRELIIRDAKRFHHFKDGVCSCRDYW